MGSPLRLMLGHEGAVMWRKRPAMPLHLLTADIMRDPLNWRALLIFLEMLPVLGTGIPHHDRPKERLRRV